MRGMRTTTIQAPSRNLVVAMISVTINVVTDPTPLIARLRCQPRCSLRRRHQCSNAEKECAEDHGHPRQCNSSIARLRLFEDRNSRRDCLDTRHRRTARSKGFEEKKNCEWLNSGDRTKLTNQGLMLKHKCF